MAGLNGKALTDELKLCKKKPRHFLFAAGSRLEDHYLYLSKKKIPKSLTKEAKAAAGAPKAHLGVVELNRDTGELEFRTSQGFSDKHGKALRALVKKRAGLTSVNAVFRLVEDEAATEIGDEAPDASGGASASVAEGERDAMARAIATINGEIEQIAAALKLAI